MSLAHVDGLVVVANNAVISVGYKSESGLPIKCDVISVGYDDDAGGGDTLYICACAARSGCVR